MHAENKKIAKPRKCLRTFGYLCLRRSGGPAMSTAPTPSSAAPTSVDQDATRLAHTSIILHPHFSPSSVTAQNAYDGPPHTHMDCTIGTAVNNIPENLETCLRKNPACIQILAVLSTFQEPPSILQIARVVGWTSEKVFEVLEPHLGPVADRFSNLILDEPLITWLFDPARSGPFCCSKTECNNLIAQWCLADNTTCDVRDIEYATRFWLYHTTQSIPSQELCTMIMASRFVLARSWSKKLGAIEIWLQRHSEGDEVKYLNMFRAAPT